MCVRYCILNCIYNRLPEDKASGSKHVEGNKIKNNINLEIALFVGLYCVIISQSTVHKILKKKHTIQIL